MGVSLRIPAALRSEYPSPIRIGRRRKLKLNEDADALRAQIPFVSTDEHESESIGARQLWTIVAAVHHTRYKMAPDA